MKLFSPGSLAVFVSTVVVQSSVDPRAYSTNDTERHEYNAGRTLSIGWVRSTCHVSCGGELIEGDRCSTKATCRLISGARCR